MSRDKFLDIMSQLHFYDEANASKRFRTYNHNEFYNFGAKHVVKDIIPFRAKSENEEIT